MMTLDERIEMYANWHHRDVLMAIYCDLNTPNCEPPWVGGKSAIRKMIKEDKRIQKYICERSDEISAECTSDKEYWRAMADCISSLVIDGNPFEEEEE